MEWKIVEGAADEAGIKKYGKKHGGEVRTELFLPCKPRRYLVSASFLRALLKIPVGSGKGEQI